MENIVQKKAKPQTALLVVRTINSITNVSTKKKHRPEGLVQTTTWGCPQDEGTPHDNANIADIRNANHRW